MGVGKWRHLLAPPLLQKKLMFNAAHLAESRALLPGYGFDDGGRPPAFDWAKLKLKRDAYVAALNVGYLDDLRDTGIAHFGAHAKFVGERRVELSTGEVIEAEHVLVATGSQPALPPVPGIEHAISSDGFFDLPALPKRVLLVGGDARCRWGSRGGRVRGVALPLTPPSPPPPAECRRRLHRRRARGHLCGPRVGHVSAAAAAAAAAVALLSDPGPPLLCPGCAAPSPSAAQRACP